jgi:hypothetical protein
MKTWQSKRRIVRSRKTGHFASKGWGKAYHRELVKLHRKVTKLFW